MPRNPEDDEYSMSGYQFPRRMKNIFPSPAEGSFDPAQGFDPSTFNKSALGGFAPFGSSYYNPYQQQQQDSDYENDYTPSSTLKRYLNLSQSKPQREDYQPTGWGRGLAAAAGAVEGYRGGANKGINAAMGVRDMPYARAMDDYGTEMDAAASALKSEQQESQLKSMAGYRSGQLNEKAADRIRKEAYDKARTDTADKKEKGLNIRFGEEIQVKRADQGARDRHYQAMDKTNDDYKKGLISESEKDRQIEAELGRERNRILGITAAAATTTAGARVTAANAAAKNAETKATAPGKAPKPVTPSAQVAAHKLAIDRAIEENPAWSRFKDKKGDLKPESSYFGFGPTVDSAEYKKLKKRVGELEKGIHSMPSGIAANDDETEEEVDY